MKKIFITLSLLITALHTFAQFKLSGKIPHLTKADTITLNLPFIYGYYRENNLQIPVDPMGNFSATLPLSAQKFGILAYKGHDVTVLLTPGKNLTLTLDTGGIYKTFGGTAAAENRLLYQVKLSEIPFFSKGTRQNSPYAKLSNAEVREKVIKPWLLARDEHIKLVQASGLSAHDKALINSEIKYNAYVQLDFFVRGIMNVDKAQINDLIQTIFEGSKPEPDVWPAGPQYYYYAGAYLSYLEFKVFAKYPPTDERSKESFKETYKISLDSATKLVKLNGKAYMKWYLLNQYFNRPVAEQYLAQTIYTQWHDKDLSHVEPLMRDLKTYFPNSKYTTLLQGKMDNLAMLNNKNLSNEAIKVFPGYEKVNSIYQVVNALKGKVVYLDIWGTWCGPCKEELTYNPQLKAHFKDKDVAFIYLDMDDDIKDAEWQTFIRVNGLTGTHLRKSNTEIQQFWEELQPNKDKRGFYPTYFIFDKNGKLVQVDAKRPSDEATLYTQLEKYL
ncbi:MAG: TlpA disulfide reductase family protein [Bacteroidota bacterium]